MRLEFLPEDTSYSTELLDDELALTTPVSCLLQVTDFAVLSCCVGSLVAAILATDDDSGINGEITYTVSEDDEEGIFFLNPVTGVFNLTRALDYEAQQYYILTVRAEDGGGQFTTIRVYFNILDINDNPPVFSTTSYSTSLMENLSPGSAILNFSVTDADDGRHFLLFCTSDDKYVFRLSNVLEDLAERAN